MPGICIKFPIRQCFNNYGEGQKIPMKWAIFATSEYFCMRVTKNFVTNDKNDKNDIVI